MVLLRKILFYVFTLAYLVFCPLFIFFALGISFRPGTPAIQQTGLIALSSRPAGAEIHLNNKLFPETTPTLLHSLRPGEYFLRLSLPDYLPWEKVLPVEGGKATIAENILLIPRQWNIQKISSRSFKEVIPIDQLPFVLLQNGSLFKDLYLYKRRAVIGREILEDSSLPYTEDRLEPLPPEASPLAEQKVKSVYRQRRSPMVLIQLEGNDHDRFLWLDLKSQPPLAQDVSALFPGRPELILWDEGTEENIYTLKEHTINHINAKNRAIYPQILQNVADFAIYRNRIYALTRNGILMRADDKGRNPVPLFSSLSEDDASPEFDDWQVAVYGEDIIVFLSPEGGLFFNQLSYPFVRSGVRGGVFDKDNQRLLIWTKDNLGILDLAKSSDPSLSSREYPLVWLDVDARDIKQAVWVNNGSQILYQNSDAVFITEVRSFHQPVVHEIARIKHDSSIGYFDNIGTLFYLNEQNHFSAIEIVPSDPLLLFPEFREFRETIELNEPKENRTRTLK